MRPEHASLIADVLIEAMPFIRRWRGRTVVIKIGGSLLDGDPEVLRSFATDVLALRSVGVYPCVVHGGGPAVGRQMKALGKEPVFIEGQRVTDPETLEIVRMVLTGKVNRELVAAINAIEPVAVGVSGEDAHLIKAVRHREELGLVGRVERIEPALLERLIVQGLVPVVATIGLDASGQALNINADAVAAHVAVALKAEKLIYLTDVEGVLADVEDPGSLISTLDPETARSLIERGDVKGGMLPKLSGCIEAVEAGVPRAHILSGKLPHSLLVEIFTEGGIGTMVSRT